MVVSPQKLHGMTNEAMNKGLLPEVKNNVFPFSPRLAFDVHITNRAL